MSKHTAIGFDVDGVVANFCHGFNKLCIQITGRDSFEPEDWQHRPPAWDWWKVRGYTEDEAKATFDAIARDCNFWYLLPLLEGASHIQEFSYRHPTYDLYFITNRPYKGAKTQTEGFLRATLGLMNPTVLIAPTTKDQIVAGLDLDHYIDDSPDHADAITHRAPRTRVFLLDRPYNQQSNTPVRYTRVPSVLGYLEAIKAHAQ